MNREQISDLIGQIDTKYVEQAAAYTAPAKAAPRRRRVKWGVAAACFVLLAVVFIVGIPLLRHNPETGKTEIVLSRSLLAIRVYASAEDPENGYTELSLEEAITIAGEHNPIFSSAGGIGIPFAFAYDGGVIELTAHGGRFLTWDVENGAGPVTDVGETYTLHGGGHIFWAPSDGMCAEGSAIDVIVKRDGYIVGLASIRIHTGKEPYTAIAELKKAVEFPMVDGKYQEIDQAYVDEFFK